MKFKVYPGYTSIGLIVDNDDSNCNLNYIDKEKRIQVRIPEIHGPNPEEFSYDNLDNTLFVKDEELPWIKAAIPAGLSSTMKKQLYPKGYSVYVKFITGDLERAVASFGDYMAGSIGTGGTVSGVTGTPEYSAFVSSQNGKWGCPVIDKDTGKIWSGLGITSGYGNRSGGFHHGIDISGGVVNKPCFATRDGKVIKVVNSYSPHQRTSSGDFGNHVIIDHGVIDGTQYYTLYGHLDYVHVTEGADVKGVFGNSVSKITSIGIVGNTGYCLPQTDLLSGTHLHFEMRLGSNDRSNTMNTKDILVDLAGNHYSFI